MGWLLLVIPLAGIAFIFIHSVWPMHMRRKRQLDRAHDLFADRTPLATGEFASSLFPDVSAVVPIELRRLLETEVGFDLARLHPGDKLVADLGLGTNEGLAPLHFAHDMEQTFGISFPRETWLEVHSFADLVSFVSKKANPNATGRP